jgi:hypothetical protein
MVSFTFDEQLTKHEDQNNPYLSLGLTFALTALCEQVQFKYRGHGVTRKCDLHPGSLIQTSTNGIAGCSWRDNLSLVMTLLSFPSKMEGIPSKERFVNQPPNIFNSATCLPEKECDD